MIGLIEDIDSNLNDLTAKYNLPANILVDIIVTRLSQLSKDTGTEQEYLKVLERSIETLSVSINKQ
jgi:hypothetical protein